MGIVSTTDSDPNPWADYNSGYGQIASAWDNRGWKTSDLRKAVINKSRRDVEILINERCDINATDRGGKTALMYAAENAKSDIVKLLLNARADGCAAASKAARYCAQKYGN